MVIDITTENEIEDLISNQPSIFYCLMENSFMVAKSIRRDFKDVNNWMGNLARKHLISSAKVNSEMLSVDMNTRLEKWKSLRGLPVVFIDGGIGKTQIFTKVPVLARAGIFKITPGEQDLGKREIFWFHPIFIGDIECGKKDRSDFIEVVLMLAEIAALRRVFYDSAYNDVRYVITHGQLLQRLSAYTEHFFSYEDYKKILNFSDTEFNGFLYGFYKNCENCRVDSTLFNCDDMRKKGRMRVICVAKYLLNEIYKIAREKSDVAIMSVVERTQRASREYSKYFLVESMIDEDPRLLKNVLQIDKLSTDLKVKNRQIEEFLSNLQMDDVILLSIALKEGEYTIPMDVIDRYSGFSAAKGLTEFGSTLRKEIPVRYSYIKAQNNSFVIRIEFPGFYSTSKIYDGLEKIYLFSRLLPNYAFPIGLDIVDKFAHVPDWMMEAYKRYLLLDIMSEIKEIKEEDIRSQLVFMLTNKRDFYYRPEGG